MSQGTRTRLIILLLAICIFSTGMFLRQQLDNSKGSKAYASALDVATSRSAPPAEPVQMLQTEPAEIPEATAPPEPIWVPAPLEEEDPYVQELESIDLTALQAENSDVLGWIFLPDSVVNYPVLQGEDNEYYLYRTWTGESNSVGSIFMETENTPDFTDFNTILYGHYIKSGAMFAHLHLYAQQDHWEKYPYVYLVNAAGIFRYEIFSAYKAEVESSTYGLSFNQTETRVNFLADAAENSVIDTAVEPAVTDRILTLSTCSGAGYSTRWVVHARLAMIQTLP